MIIRWKGGMFVDFFDVISLLGGVALFLFGMSLMGDSLKKVAGNKLELILYTLTSNPFKGFLLGTGVTAIIQSSSATSVMVVGFVNSGMMKVKQAIGIILGAILGTSITGWVLALSSLSGGAGWVQLLSTSTLTGLVAVVGIVLYMFSNSLSKQHVGGILMGFAILMFGMSAMSSAVSPLRESETFIHALTTFSNPLLGILVGALITAVLQSASAAVGILQALAVTGALTFANSFPIILGIAIGAAAPVLLSSIGATVDGKRTAWIYLVVELIGAAIVGVVFYLLNSFIGFSFMDWKMTMVTIALVNTIYRAVKVLVLLPFVGQLEKLVDVLIKDKPNEVEMAAREDFERLEERFLQYPALAIEQVRLTVTSMACRAQTNIAEAIKLFDEYTEAGFKRVVDEEETIDTYEDKLTTYIAKINSNELNEEQAGNVQKYLHSLTDFERMSDHALNLAECAQELHSKGLEFSEPAKKEIRVLRRAVTEVLDISIGGFIDNDIGLAYRVEPLEELIDDLCREMKLHHVERAQKGLCGITQGFVYNDVLTNYERISDHCSNIAVAMIEIQSGEFEAHSYVEGVLAMHSHSFDKYYNEYSEKYNLDNLT